MKEVTHFIPQDQLQEKPLLDLLNEHYINYLMGINFSIINLNGMEANPAFILKLFSGEYLRHLFSLFTSLTEKIKPELYKTLVQDNKINMNKTAESFVELDNHTKEFLFKETTKQIYGTKNNPLKELIRQPALKKFFKGLNLTLIQQLFFITNLINSELEIVYPQNISDDKKTFLFSRITNDYTGKDQNLEQEVIIANELFIKLGLFSAPWKISDVVSCYFKNISLLISLKKLRSDTLHDKYNYSEIQEKNSTETQIFLKQVKGCIENKTNAWFGINGESEFRNKNYLTYICEKSGISVFEFHEEYQRLSNKEVEFYLYALSVSLCEKNCVIYLPAKYYAQLQEEESETCCRITPSKEYSLAQKTLVPIITTLNQDITFQEQDFQYSFFLKLPAREHYRNNACRYFYENKMPEHLLEMAASKCYEQKISPEQWDNVINKMKTASCLSKEEAEMVFEKSFPIAQSNLRKNTGYCFEALNTSYPAKDLIKILQNVQTKLKVQTDSESGIRILLYGISGTGKTAYVEEIAKKLNLKLIILRPSEVLSKFVGDTEKNISSMFRQAAHEKAILLIDEADSLLLKRGDIFNRHNDSMVNTFLVEMENFPGILFCNTNLPENLDDATDRRFHFKVEFKPLTLEGVELLCDSCFGSYRISKVQQQRIFECGNVTPGDFGKIKNALRFEDQNKINADYITQKLCQSIREKSNNKVQNEPIGFFCN